MDSGVAKEINWLKAQITSLESSVSILNLKLKFAEAENEHNKEMLTNKHEEPKKKDC